eukprot:COSAG05_NODE_603_length_8402_cov_7.090931_6_plen_227_part_00
MFSARYGVSLAAVALAFGALPVCVDKLVVTNPSTHLMLAAQEKDWGLRSYCCPYDDHNCWMAIINWSYSARLRIRLRLKKSVELVDLQLRTWARPTCSVASTTQHCTRSRSSITEKEDVFAAANDIHDSFPIRVRLGVVPLFLPLRTLPPPLPPPLLLWCWWIWWPCKHIYILYIYYIYRIHITQVGMRSVEDVERNLAQIQEKVPASLWLEAQGQGLLRPELQFQ